MVNKNGGATNYFPEKGKENHVANGICKVVERFNCVVRVSSASIKWTTNGFSKFSNAHRKVQT
jgi:hypothetical protein